MDRVDRIYALHKLLRHARRPVPTDRIRAELECSRATVRRTVQHMRDHLDAPIVSDHQDGGYWYDERGGERFELPGLWFNPSELHALMASLQLLREVEPGLLERDIAPLRDRIQRILAREETGGGEAERRVRILRMAAREVDPATFRTVAEGALGRRRLGMTYHSRSRDEQRARSVSPQRLSHYRDNWYLDAWCHTIGGMRIFSVDRIEAPRLLDEPARDIPDVELDAHLADAYGIFGGRADRTAVLVFEPGRARWVAEERWHPEQEGRFRSDGRYELRVPYGEPTELILDILRYGPEVEVLSPTSLREAVEDRLTRAARRYAGR